MTNASNPRESPKSNERQARRSEERAKDPKTAALDRCDDLIDWYQSNADHQSTRMNAARSTAIILSGLTPVLVVIQLTVEDLQVWRLILSILIALFAATAAISSALDRMFLWRDNYIRFSQAAEQLKSEKNKYLTRAGRRYDPELDEHKALTNFVTKVELITLEETKGWRALMEQAEELESLLAAARQAASLKGATMPDGTVHE